MPVSYRKLIHIGLSIICLIVCNATLPAQEAKWTDAEQELLDSGRALSKTTQVEGEGWEAYGKILHADFTRWVANRNVVDREGSIRMIREWWEAGNRQSSSEDEPISVQITGDTGVVRKQMNETYVDSEGHETGSFSGFVTQVWIRENGSWKLLAVTIQPDGG